MSPDEVAAGLRSRGIVLNSGLLDEQIDNLMRILQSDIDDYVRSIFKTFDGFGVGQMDPRSYINIWPLSRVAEEHTSTDVRVSFGDFLMDSNEYTMCLNDSSQPVLLEGAIVASSLQEFWTRLIQGEFDI